MKYIKECKIINNNRINPGANPPIYDMLLHAPGIYENGEPKPGQFACLYTGRGEMLLPRPISFCDTDNHTQTIRFVYQVAGQGTSYISNLGPGSYIKVNGPLGNGFMADDTASHHYLIGGGIGTPPLLFLAKWLHTKFNMGNITAVLGFRVDPILAQDFGLYCQEVHIATDSGKTGYLGSAVSLFRDKLAKTSMDNNDISVYACGPKAMLSALAGFTASENIPTQVSLEERMACGIGACVGCVVEYTEENKKTYKCICKDGPVFKGSYIFTGGQGV